MPFRREQAASGLDTTFASTVSATFPNTTQVGSIIIIAWEGDAATAINKANTPTDTAGNLYIRGGSVVNSGSFDVEGWYAINKAATAGLVVTVTDTLAGADGILIIEEWTGAANLTVIDKISSNTGSLSPLTSGNLTTLQPDDLLFVIGAEAVGANDLTAQAGFSNLTQNATTFTNLGICSQVVAQTGTYNGGFTSLVGVSWACLMIAFRRAPSGTTTSISSTSISSTSSSISTTSSSISSTSASSSTSSTSASTSSTSSSISSTSSSISSTSSSSTSQSTSISSTSSSISSTSFSSTSQSSTSSSTSISSTSSSFSSTSSSISSTSASFSSTSASSTSASTSVSTTTVPANLNFSYQDQLTLPTNANNLLNAFTNKQVANVQGDDGDYFIEYGSEYLTREYKFRNKNNTDAVTFTWKGRSTESTTISPILIQIYNVNSATWETLSRETRVAADVDFTATVTQSTNLSNYYDANNVVTFRSYQQVI